jgi:hypothetical protein
MGKPVVPWELMSKEPEKVAAFYEKIFDWKIQHYPEMNYRIVDTGDEGGINGGILKPQREGPWPSNMFFYIEDGPAGPLRPSELLPIQGPSILLLAEERTAERGAIKERLAFYADKVDSIAAS